MHRFALLLLVGCGSSSLPMATNDAGSNAPVMDAAPPPTPIEWEPCTLRTEGTGPAAECAKVPVPLRSTDPNGETIDIFVKRYKPGSGAKQLWLLMGGPGGSGYGYEALAEAIGAKYTDIEFYIPDHRGTGRSARIGCPQESTVSQGGFAITQGEWPACLQAVQMNLGEKLSAFSTTNAANDIGVIIERARKPGQPVFVYGASYGTYWGHRYLQLYPKQADGVILDSIAAPGMSLARQDQDADEAGKLFFDSACKTDSLCSQKLGSDPWAKAQAVFAKLKMGSCNSFALGTGLPAHSLLRRAFGQIMMGFTLRPYIPAMIYRIDRCSPADEAALAKMVTLIFGGGGNTKLFQLWGWVLSNNILFSEMWETPSPTVMDLINIRENAIVSRDVTSGMDALVGKWPAYPKDPYIDAWAETDLPLLMFAGGLDPATIFRKQLAFKPHFTKPNQTWLEFPLAGHGILSTTPTKANTSCGTAIMMSFMNNPRGTLDTSCMQDLQLIDFAGKKETTQLIFGTDDPWE